jgi:REP element-mobilizing transposase RayT
MPYDSNQHHRRSLRLKGYDYSQEGLYFVTICCQNRLCRFGQIVNGEMMLNEYGKIAYNEWLNLQKRYPNVTLDVFQIMPNHIHGIIALDTVGATLAVAPNNNSVAQNDKGAGASPAPTIGNIVGAYKSLVMNTCLQMFKSQNKYMGKLWQRNYYEHIIRNNKSYQNIADYIIKNPAKWCEDKFFNE